MDSIDLLAQLQVCSLCDLLIRPKTQRAPEIELLALRHWLCGASEDEYLLVEDEEFEIAIGVWTATEDEEVDRRRRRA